MKRAAPEIFWDYPVRKQSGRASLPRCQRGLQINPRRRRSSTALPVFKSFVGHLCNSKINCRRRGCRSRGLTSSGLAATIRTVGIIRIKLSIGAHLRSAVKDYSQNRKGVIKGSFLGFEANPFAWFAWFAVYLIRPAATFSPSDAEKELFFYSSPSPCSLSLLLVGRGEGEAFAWFAYFAVQDRTSSGPGDF